MKSFLTRAAAACALGAALAGPAQADVVYKYTGPVADTATTIANGIFESADYTGQGPLVSFTFTRTGNSIGSLTSADLSGLEFIFSFAGRETHFTYWQDPADEEQPFIEFEPGTSARPSGWLMHGLVDIAGIGALYFESTSSFDFTTQATGPDQYLALSAGSPGMTDGHGVWAVTQVPEPGTLSIFVLAAALLFAGRKAFNRRA